MEEEKLVFQYLLDVLGFFCPCSRITRAVSEQVHCLSGQMEGLCHHQLTDLSGFSEEG